MSYSKELEKTIASEIFRLTGGNPGSTSQTLYAIRSQSVPIDDPIRIRRMFVDGKISRFSDSSI
jgi:hypothetical protein